MSRKPGRWGIRREFFKGSPSEGVPDIAASVEASSFKSGQEVVFADDASGKVAANLNQTVSNKITNSLQLPAEAPATDKLVAIGTNGAQKLVDPPSGGNIVYQDFCAMTSDGAGDYVQRLSVSHIPAQGDFRVVLQLGDLGSGFTVEALGNAYDLSQISGSDDMTVIAGYEGGVRYTHLYAGAIEKDPTSTGTASRSMGISPQGPNAFDARYYSVIY